ncbi:TetR family transcriptional regulator [Tsukamurella pulmonis]|uniref:DNA-binding transcriptional regulator, AcrR family n=1 Tax=Tsukamurella pulmonis TaxID=47312 RepID=A0A1H1AUA2_9ACTN|nr:TetR/AcrR family transcriptional regulator [Tsukamurella pulmonis]KXO92859.1 TetR family transcriptional regulator [Tsukamurella pulmonis]KXP08184.1 TetR family transcriptional regulator [Tsukamurella pulmonis]SDQ43257.1 DNA-binding transcriptional regulator, AcrR family [Tsukamurella pulmonis]SUP26094.1 Bacterial regulatory proteins, tetR family [Tsukamurella pulmonis]
MSPARSSPSRYVQLRFLEAGLAVLAERGHAALKLAAVCAQAGSSTGSFYHAFPSWPEFTSALIGYWRETKSDRIIEAARRVPDARERLLSLIDTGMTLPHATEAAIRVWAAHDPEVAQHQAQVDRERRDVIAEAYTEVLGDPALAQQYATTALYLLVGYESGTLQSPETLAFAFRTFSDVALGAAGDPPDPEGP